MGLFLNLIGVQDVDLDAVTNSVKLFAAQSGEVLSPLEDPHFDEESYILTRSGQGNVLVLFPKRVDDFEPLAKLLSETLNRPAIAMHIHDGDFWLYELFVAGNSIDRYCPQPEWLGYSEIEEIARWRGNAAILCQNWRGLASSTIERYLVPWPEDVSGKAYPDDEYEYGRDWQVLDFARKLGLEYLDENRADQEKIGLVRVMPKANTLWGRIGQFFGK